MTHRLLQLVSRFVGALTACGFGWTLAPRGATTISQLVEEMRLVSSARAGGEGSFRQDGAEAKLADLALLRMALGPHMF